MMVVFFHAAIQVGLTTGAMPLPGIGATGVDIFFVLSGFVMWRSTSERHAGAADFVKRRLIRIAPLYWLMTLVAAALALAAPSVLHSLRVEPGHLLASLLFVPWRNPAGAAFAADPFAPLVVPGWTLNLEMMFYVLFAFALVLPRARRLPVLAGLVGIVFAVGAFVVPHDNPLSFYGKSIMLEFVAGVALAAVIAPRLPRGGVGAALVLVASLAALLVSDWLRPSVPDVFRFGIPAFVTVAAALSLERSGRVPRLRLLEAMGNASYSTYLTHVFVIAGLRIALQLAGMPLQPGGALAFVLVALVAAALVGDVVHRLVERRLVLLANALLRPGKRRPPAAASFSQS